MNRLLISPNEVIELAYSPSEQVRPEQISASVIKQAQQKYIKPKLNGVFDAIGEGRYYTLLDSYVKPALAHYVKYLLMPSQNSYLMMLASGTERGESVSRESFYAMKHEALSRANTLRDMCVSVIEANPDLYPEYAKTNTTVIIGGVVI